MKYINQRDYPHWLYITRTDMEGEDKEYGKTTTVKSSACGLCAAIMVADRLLVNYDFDLTAAIQLSYDQKANYRAGTSYARFAPAFAEKLGLKMEVTSDVEEMRRCIRTGGAAVALVIERKGERVGLFTHSAHYISVIDEEADGRFVILDPSFTDTKFEEEGRKGKVEIKNGVIILCDAATLDAEADPNNPPYYLFWRK